MSKNLANVRHHARSRLAGTTAKFQQQANRQLAVLKPFFDICEGEARFLPIEKVEPESIKASILTLANSTKAHIGIRVVAAKDWKNLPLDHEEYAYLPVQMAMLESARIGAMMGQDEFKDLLELMSDLAPGLGHVLVEQFGDYFTNAQPGLRTAIISHFYLFAAAFMGVVMVDDADGVRRIAPFVRNMAQVIIIGAPKSDPRSWDVLCA